MKIYSMKGLAKAEKVHPDYLRVVIGKYRKGEITSWRGYQFFGIEGKAWFACSEKEQIDFFD